MANIVGLLTTSSKKATDESSFANDLIMGMLDQDGDGSIIDDIAGMALGSQQKKGGLGGLIGGLFDK